MTFKDEQLMSDTIEKLNVQELDDCNITVNKVQPRGSGAGGGELCGSRCDGGGYGHCDSGYGGNYDRGYGDSCNGDYGVGRFDGYGDDRG